MIWNSSTFQDVQFCITEDEAKQQNLPDVKFEGFGELGFKFIQSIE